MIGERVPLHLPNFDEFSDKISVLALHVSASFVHGMMCGYLCAGADNQGEAYIRALLNNKKDEASRDAILAVFAVFSISQQQLYNFDLEFQMLLPDDEEPLTARAQAFSEWCDGFIQSLTAAGVSSDHFEDEDARDAFQHLIEFSELNSDILDVDEDDERALMEVGEYARMAVLRLHSDLIMKENEQGGTIGLTH